MADPSWTGVARSAMLAVVNISSSKIVRSDRGPFFNDPFFRFFFEGPGTTVRRERSLGSGVTVSSEGYVPTNNHVVENAQEIRVLGDRREFKARPIGTDPETDPLGMTIAEVTPEIARRLGLRNVTSGVVVAELAPGGLAKEAGLRPGDVIQEVNRQPIRSRRDLGRAFESARGKDLVLLINRAGQTAYLVIERG